MKVILIALAIATVVVAADKEDKRTKVVLEVEMKSDIPGKDLTGYLGLAQQTDGNVYAPVGISMIPEGLEDGVYLIYAKCNTEVKNCNDKPGESIGFFVSGNSQSVAYQKFKTGLKLNGNDGYEHYIFTIIKYDDELHLCSKPLTRIAHGTATEAVMVEPNYKPAAKPAIQCSEYGTN